MKDSLHFPHNNGYFARDFVSSDENCVKLKNSNFFDFRLPDCDLLKDIKFSSGVEMFTALGILSAIKFFSKITPKEWVQLHSQWLARIFSHSFAASCRKLEEKGLIIRSQQYKVGEYSKSFKLGPALAGIKWKVANFKEEAKKLMPKCKFHRDYWESFILEIKESNQLPEDHPLKPLRNSILDLLQDVTFEWDENTEKEILEEAQKAQIKGEKLVAEQNLAIIKKNKWRVEKGWKEQPLKWVETTVESIAEGYRDAINAFSYESEKYVKVHIDKVRANKVKPGTNRVFTNITNLKGTWRKNLRYKGQKMVNVDIRCAQPSMMSSVYGSSPAEQAEKQRFMQFMTDFDFYGELAARSKGNKLTRDDAKKETFTLMFAKNYTMYQKNLYKVLEKEFPILASLIAGAKKDDYKNFAFILQSTEAEIMIKGVLSELLLEKSIPAFSIHDSIMCLPEHREIVEETIKRKFCDKLGFNPVLKDG